MNKEFLLELYRRMVRIRDFEEGVIQLYIKGIMPGLAHCYPGEEATAVGVCAALRPNDYITSTHRGHGHLIAKGGRTDRMMAEVLGKEAGYNKGRGGTMHIADLSLGILGANGIVGGSIGIAAGAGWSIQQRGTDQVSVCFYGDGASNEGVTHESMNLSRIWDLPVIYVCENNMYGMYTAASRVVGSSLTARAEGMGLHATSVDGQDVLAVYDALSEVVDRVRRGGGPEFVECKTYRRYGHHVGDPGKAYRPAEEIAEWNDNHDPLKLLSARLLADRICTAAEIAAVDEEIQKEVDDAIEFAKAAPFPDVSEVALHVKP